MKKLLWIILLLISIQAFSQNRKTIFRGHFNNRNGISIASLDFWLSNNSTGEVIYSKTDKRGYGQAFLERGTKYKLFIKKDEPITEIEVPADFTDCVVYYATVDITNIKINPADTVYMNFKQPVEAKNDEADLRFIVADLKNYRLSGITVKLFSTKLNKVFVSQSNNEGKIRFLVPEGKYYISMGILENYKEFEAKKYIDFPLTEILTYENTKVKESIKNDTIVQKIPYITEGTSELALINIKLIDYNRLPINEETVWLNHEGSKKVYVSKTDQFGVAKYLVPKGERYSVHVKYERNVDLFEFPYENGFVISELRFMYVGSRNIEKFFKEAKRDMNGFLTEFKSVPIQAEPIPEGVYEKTSLGFNFNFLNKSNLSAPFTIDDQIFISGGYCSPAFYKYDAKTGKFSWGIRFSESGPSPVVYSEDVILINTQSCTLYAIDANNGNLLWSKWLGPNIYSTPSVANGKVFAVYPNELLPFAERLKKAGEFALVAFDLHTGNIVWQGWLNDEVIGAPVIANQQVFITTHKGTVYKFDETDGKLLVKRDLNAINSPTIVENYLYLNHKKSQTESKHQLIVLNTSDLSTVNELSYISGELTNLKEFSADALMSFNANRVVHFNGKNFCAINGKLICFDAKNFKPIWTQQFDNPTSSKYIFSPILVNGKIVINTSAGYIKMYDSNSGILLKQWDSKSLLIGDPIVDKGMIYSGAQNGRMVSISTGDISLNGWNMWGKDGTHNLYLKK